MCSHILTAMLSISLLLVACSGQPKPAAPIGSPLPALQVSDVLGAGSQLSALASGKVAMVLFWQRDCEFCKREMPLIEPIYQKYKDKGFVFIGVLLGDDTGAVTDIVAKHKLTFPMVMDTKSEARGRFGIVGVPMIFVLDRGGVVREKVLGGLGAQAIDEMAAEKLK